MNRRRPPVWLTISAALVAALALLPLVYLVIRIAGAGDAAWATLRRPATWEVFVNSLALAGATTLGSVAIGAPLAWLTTRSDLPGRRFWSVAVILPLAMPSYIMAYTLMAVAGAGGPLRSVLARLHARGWPELSSGFTGSFLALTLINYPFVTLTMRAALRRLDPGLEEAARGLGAGRREIVRRVLLPQLWPALTAGALLVALYALSDFGTPSLMRYRTFTRVVYTQYANSFDRSGAALTASILALLTLALVGAETLTRGRGRHHRAGAQTQRRTGPVRLGRWTAPALLFCAAVVGLAIVMPAATMIAWIAVGVSNGQPIRIPAHLIAGSAMAGALAGVAAVVAAGPVAFLGTRYGGRLATALDRAAYIGNALPGVVIALALVFFGSRFPLVYQTMPLLILAYVTRFLPQALGALRANLLQLNPRLEEVGRGLGRSRFYVFTRVTAPLMAPGVAAAAALVFLSAVKELPITLLLRPTGFDTLVTEIWSAAQESLFSQAAPPALLLSAISALSVWFILRQEERLGS